ncbi:MAG: hypothetical protein EDM79_21515, partial [Chloroflexi bacterium]
MFSFSRRFFHLIILAALTASLAGGTMSVTPARAAGTLYAAPADLGSGDCSSWASACDLQQALSAATSGDQIWVMSGVHKPTNTTDRTISFSLESGVEIYGGFAGTETSLNQRDPNVNITVLSGDIDGNDTVDGNGVTTTISGSNSYHVVTASSVGATAILDGFIITGGRANGLSPADLGFGGGMFNWNSNPTLANVTFSGNFADFGGGIFNASSSPALINVTFSGNIASEDGGGTYNSNRNPTLTNVTFSGNSAAYGGGMFNSTSNPTLTNATFSGNSATFGGGMLNINSSSPTLKNVLIANSSSGDCAGDNFHASSSNNLIEDSGSACGLTNGANGNIAGQDPKLGPLQNNGGFTQTHGLLPGSPAIDAGNIPECPLDDQRGQARPFGPACDIGAYELNYGSATFHSSGTQDGWVLESSETSGMGGTMNASAATFDLGDDASNRQYRVILS